MEKVLNNTEWCTNSAVKREALPAPRCGGRSPPLPLGRVRAPGGVLSPSINTDKVPKKTHHVSTTCRKVKVLTGERKIPNTGKLLD